MRAILGLVLLAGLLSAAPPEPPKTWLVLESVDRRGRRPFNPDGVFARYLLERRAAPPKEGEEVAGTAGTKRWKRVAAPVSGRIGYAYAAVESESDQVVLAVLEGGGRLYVNGDAFVGDIYASRHGGVPVLLRKGQNHLFVRGVRGRFVLKFLETNRGVVALKKDATLPDAIEGRPINSLAGVVVVNASSRPAAGFVPLGVRKFQVQVKAREFTTRGATFRLELRKPGQPYRRTFLSGIDGSVQQYAVLPPLSRAGAGLVLTLHGASVDCHAQARSYSRKRNLWIIAPTNRRPFGFDWQDWGRADAYEVLDDALVFTAADPSRLYLTGHSMGGHGTWHLAANDPDQFAAIAPSAGWATFDTYVGRPKQDPLWLGADGASDTLGLIANVAQTPVFILHGAADDNVPVREARLMETLLAGQGVFPRVHYQPGAGHWWNGKAAKGTDCVDWPGIFEHFLENRRPSSAEVKTLEFISVDPAVDSRHHWIRVLQAVEQGKPLYLRASVNGAGVIDVRTRNVRRFAIDRPARIVRIDGRQLTTRGPLNFLRTGAGWRQAQPSVREKGPRRSGPFKRAFLNRFVFVYGDEESMARARFDAQVWWYRGNGDVPVLSDRQFLAGDYRGRNVIVFGNATTNRAWREVFPRTCPIVVEEGRMSLGERVWYGGDRACVFVYPRRGEPEALAAAFAATGPRGQRLGYTLLPFVSGVGYPDYAVFSTDILTKGDGGVLKAGWFSHDWSLPR